MGILQEGAKLLLKGQLEEINNQRISDQNNVELLTERLAELELAMEDVGWLQLTYGTENQFSRDALRKIAYLSRLYYLKNPIIHRGIEVQQNYVWGSGVTVKAREEKINAVVQEFWNDNKNRQELTSHNAQQLKELDLNCDGNIFFVIFTNKTNGKVQLRSIPFEQIAEKETNPEDSKEPWLYLRMWSDSDGKQHKEYYPDWRYQPKYKSKSGVNVNDKASIYHIKIGGFSDWKFGCPTVYSALDWAKAYKEFLEDWATITRALSRFAWKASGAKSRDAMSAIVNKFNTTWSSATTETNPKPAVGSIAVTKEGHDLEPIKTAGATTTPESGRRIFLMAAAGLGLPETFFGDVSVGTLATANSLNRPTELAMKSRQTFWKDVLMDLINYVLYWAVKAGTLKGEGTVSTNEYGVYDVEWKDAKYQDVVEITFPQVVEPDKFKEIESITKVAPLGLLDEEQLTKMILIALGEQDVEQIMDKMKEEPNEELPEMIEKLLEKYFKLRS